MNFAIYLRLSAVTLSDSGRISKRKKFDASRDLVPFAQFQKHKKHPQRSATFSKVAD